MGGEKMKRENIIVSLVAILMLLAVVSPVLAAPAQKFPVILITQGKSITPAERAWTTDGGIEHSFGAVRGGPVYLTIGTGPIITGTYIETGNSIINHNTGQAIVHLNNMVCTFPGGSFEGEKTLTSTTEIRDGVPVTFEQSQHAVLHGSGIYEGQTLKIGYDWVLTNPPLPKIYEGILIVP
jgi:hypothetical protein